MNIKLDIPENFYRGEERCGYYVSPQMKKFFAVLLDLIMEFARVCEKYNLRWYMNSGTLLGAVRHKGFIPWDEDVDVSMMRKDYDKFLKIASSEFKHPYFLADPKKDYSDTTLISRLYNESTTLFFAKSPAHVDLDYIRETNIHAAIFIDIFPIDGLPDDEKKLRQFAKKVKKLNFIINKLRKYADFYRPATKLWKRPFKAVVHYLAKIMNLSYVPFQQKLLTLSEIFDSDYYFDSKYVAELAMMLHDKKFLSHRVLERSYFDDIIYLPFEMLNLPAPSGYEHILNQYYFNNWHEYIITPWKTKILLDTEHSYTYYTKEGYPIEEINK